MTKAVTTSLPAGEFMSPLRLLAARAPRLAVICLVLLLALLLNLSGHMFLHLGDAVLEAEATHFTSHEEQPNFFAPQHQCSVCQDHQQLALDSPATASYFVEAPNLTTNRSNEFPSASLSFQRPSDRAPPRN